MPAEYRQKDLFDARAFNATRLELVRNGTTTAFEKVKRKNKDGKEQETWKQVAPGAKDVDQTKVENLHCRGHPGARLSVRRRGGEGRARQAGADDDDQVERGQARGEA